MRALLLVVATLALHPVVVGAQRPDAARREPRDTARLGELVRLIMAPDGPWQTARFLEASEDSVFLGGGGGWLRTAAPRASVERIQVMRPSLRGAAAGAGVGGAVGLGFAALALAGLSSCNDCEAPAAWPLAAAAVAAMPAAAGALLGWLAHPRSWRDGSLPAVAAPRPGAVAPTSPALSTAPSVYIFVGPEMDAGTVSQLGQRLALAGVHVADVRATTEPWPGPGEVRYFDRRETERAEGLALWLARLLARPDLRARLQPDGTVPRGELQVWLPR